MSIGSYPIDTIRENRQRSTLASRSMNRDRDNLARMTILPRRSWPIRWNVVLRISVPIADPSAVTFWWDGIFGFKLDDSLRPDQPNGRAQTVADIPLAELRARPET
jgi:hypothetical protein